MHENTELRTTSTQTSIKALLAIRDFDNTKLAYQIQLKKVESDFEALIQSTLEITKRQTTPKTVKIGQTLIQEFKDSFNTLYQAFNAIVIRIELKNRMSAAGLWNILHIQIEILKNAYQNLVDFGDSNLKDLDSEEWKKSIGNFQVLILPTVQIFIASCKLELKIIESFSSHELNKVISYNLKSFPKGFVFEETEDDNASVLKEWQENFAREKKLWAIFSKIIKEI